MTASKRGPRGAIECPHGVYAISKCRTCMNARAKIYNKRWREKHPEQWRASRRRTARKGRDPEWQIRPPVSDVAAARARALSLALEKVRLAG